MNNHSYMIHTKNIQPTTIILFGAMGDLAARKLLPSLFDLYLRKALPINFHILGASREDVTDEDFQSHVKDILPKVTKDFLSKISYTQMDLLNADAYDALEAKLQDISATHYDGIRGDRLFHLAVPPTLYKDIFIYLGESKLAQDSHQAWNRILVEKPFGFDLASAKELNATIGKHLHERQIYRVDHYLAKEAVENIIAFRFSNVIFDNVWNKNNITSVHIRMHEKLDVSNRGAFYETVGALRDIGQNHLLQILAIIAMQQPASLEPGALSYEREVILSALRLQATEDILKNSHRAQYKGYTKTKGVVKSSTRETFFAIKAFVDTPEWENVPFFIEGGKAMPEDKIDITITFKRNKPCLCGVNMPEHTHANTLTFTLKPENKTEIRFWVKEPGIEYSLEEHSLSFTHSKEEMAKAPNAYADVLFDALHGEKTIFPSDTEVEASWAFIMPILKSWQENKDTFELYDKGTVPDIASTIEDASLINHRI